MQNLKPDWAAIANRLNKKYGSDALVVAAIRQVLPDIQDSYRNQLGAMRRGMVKDPSFSIGAAMVWLDSQAAAPVQAGIQQRVAAIEESLQPKPVGRPEKLPESISLPPVKFTGAWTPGEVYALRHFIGLSKKEMAEMMGYEGVSAGRKLTALEGDGRTGQLRQRVLDALNWLYELAAANKPLAPYPHKQAHGDPSQDPRIDRMIEKFGGIKPAARRVGITASHLYSVKLGLHGLSQKVSDKIDAVLAE